MSGLPVIAVFDIGRTNKKIFLFDEQYKIAFEECVSMEETTDADGFPCEDLNKLTSWVSNTFKKLAATKEFSIRGINASAYGASFVHIDNNNTPFLPLYNYLKPYPPSLREEFYNKYGGENQMSLETASPVLGNLNSGMQLYYLKYRAPEFFARIKYSLHLPQYISYILTKKICSEITSVGCHTLLWNFKKKGYHRWVEDEGLQEILPALCPAEKAIRIQVGKNSVAAGIGLHDSSAALLPYLISFNYSFVLISTGTWCISLNPFNNDPLTQEELKEDCLCYLSYNGKPVKASRLFAGNEHGQQVKKLSAHFNKPLDYYSTVIYDPEIISSLRNNEFQIERTLTKKQLPFSPVFSERDLSLFNTYERAYHQLMYDIVVQQKKSTGYVIQGTDIRRIFVDGGFSKNHVYMFLLAAAFPGIEIFGASVSQASAIGSAMVIHKHWNEKPLPGNIVELKYYSATF